MRTRPTTARLRPPSGQNPAFRRCRGSRNTASAGPTSTGSVGRQQIHVLGDLPVPQIHRDWIDMSEYCEVSFQEVSRKPCAEKRRVVLFVFLCQKWMCRRIGWIWGNLLPDVCLEYPLTKPILLYRSTVIQHQVPQHITNTSWHGRLNMFESFDQPWLRFARSVFSFGFGSLCGGWDAEHGGLTLRGETDPTRQKRWAPSKAIRLLLGFQSSLCRFWRATGGVWWLASFASTGVFQVFSALRTCFSHRWSSQNPLKHGPSLQKSLRHRNRKCSLNSPHCVQR